MRIMVDQRRCQTVGLCVRDCPEVFRFQEGSKKATVIVDEIPPALEQRCRRVASACPTRAIIIEE